MLWCFWIVSKHEEINIRDDHCPLTSRPERSPLNLAGSSPETNLDRMGVTLQGIRTASLTIFPRRTVLSKSLTTSFTDFFVVSTIPRRRSSISCAGVKVVLLSASYIKTTMQHDAVLVLQVLEQSKRRHRPSFPQIIKRNSRKSGIGWCPSSPVEALWVSCCL